MHGPAKRIPREVAASLEGKRDGLLTVCSLTVSVGLARYMKWAPTLGI